MIKSIGPNDIVPPKYYSGWGHGEHNKHEQSYIVDSSSNVEPLLRDIKGRKGITDFRLVADETNNGPEIIDTNQFMVDYTFKISDEIDTSGPFKSAFQASTEGVIRQEFITYRMRDGMMIKEVNVRKYTPNDYIDSKDVIPLGEIDK